MQGLKTASQETCSSRSPIDQPGCAERAEFPEWRRGGPRLDVRRGQRSVVSRGCRLGIVIVCVVHAPSPAAHHFRHSHRRRASGAAGRAERRCLERDRGRGKSRAGAAVPHRQLGHGARSDGDHRESVHRRLRSAADDTGPDRVAQRRRWPVDLGVHPRRRQRPDDGGDRRRADERSFSAGGRLQLRQPVDQRRRAHRDPAWRAVDPVRQPGDGRCDQHRDRRADQPLGRRRHRRRRVPRHGLYHQQRGRQERGLDVARVRHSGTAPAAFPHSTSSSAERVCARARSAAAPACCATSSHRICNSTCAATTRRRAPTSTASTRPRATSATTTSTARTTRSWATPASRCTRPTARSPTASRTSTRTRIPAITIRMRRPTTAAPPPRLSTASAPTSAKSTRARGS